jgi:hypothetical protein
MCTCCRRDAKTGLSPAVGSERALRVRRSCRTDIVLGTSPSKEAAGKLTEHPVQAVEKLMLALVLAARSFEQAQV